jgi:hypothetical protein
MSRAFHIAILLVCAGVIAAAIVLDVDDAGVYIFGWKLPLQCVMYEATGVRCASCGLTRGLCYAAHGEMAKAFEMNSVWPAVAAMILLEIFYRLLAIVRWPRKVPQPVFAGHIAVLIVVAVLVLGYWIVYLGGLFR